MLPAEAIMPIIERKLEQLGLELYDLKLFRAGPRSIVRVFIDRQGGVTIDDCENASNEISILLDVEQFSAGPYTLEVSSPGLDRPLTTARDFLRVVGRSVSIRASDGAGRQRTITGKLVEMAGDVLKLETDKGMVEMPLASVCGGKVEISFS